MLLPFTRLLLFVFLLVLNGCSDEKSTVLEIPSADIVIHNHGVGLMGKFEYEKAREVFQQLAAKYPDWLDVQLDLAIATLNRQKTGDELIALDTAKRIIEQQPQHLRANYIAGLMSLYLGNIADAAAFFRVVAEEDPKDAYAAYYLGQCLAQQGKDKQALEWYQRAKSNDPYLRSAYYGAFQSLQRLERKDEASRMVADYSRLEKNPRANLAEFKYTRMGPKAEVKAFRQISKGIQQKAPPLQGRVFEDAVITQIELPETLQWKSSGSVNFANITVADINNDGFPDLFIPAAMKLKHDVDNSINAVLIRKDNGRFKIDLTHPLVNISNINTVLWGDIDNDGLTDVYLCRNGANQLWKQLTAGVWKDITAESGTDGGAFNTVDGHLFDADHDGDLDIFLINADGANELLNNDRNGSFTPIAADRKITGNGSASRQILPVDLDTDRDVDLIIINQSPPHEVYINDRLWNYHQGSGFDEFINTPISAIVAGDINADGLPELYSADINGTLFVWRNVDNVWQKELLSQVNDINQAKLINLDKKNIQLELTDVNGDGRSDLIFSGMFGWIAYDLTQLNLTQANLTQAKLSVLYSAITSEIKPKAIVSVVSGISNGPEIFALAEEGIYQWNAGKARYPFLTLSFTGKENDAKAMRSNASGIGTRVTVRNGSNWYATSTFRNHSSPGQNNQAITLGLAGAEKADFIAIDWSDGVFQSELDLEVNKHHIIHETQRQLSSCPVLFVWSGNNYEFVSDILGVGGIGFALGRGIYSTPRPQENFLLPQGLIKPHHGRYKIKITEPMEEIAYIDAAKLVAYDLPVDWQIILDERMATGGEKPTGKTYFFKETLFPARVTNERGENVTDQLKYNDKIAAPPGPGDDRFLGRLASEHILTMTFPEPINVKLKNQILVMNGWVEYPYSQTMFSAWQAGATYASPTLEAQGSDGKWQIIQENFGYPAGMPRKAAYVLHNLPAGTIKLRLRSNLEIYWDQIFIAFSEQPENVTKHNLSLLHAHVARTGFPARSDNEQKYPHYNYDKRSQFWDTRYAKGFYTNFGPMHDLVHTVDDALAVIGPGEEIHLEYEQAPELENNKHRFFVLETYGWVKDMDLYTLHGETVDPLPANGHLQSVAKQLHARYNTRYQAGR